ncbi:MAG: hypothetical protein AAF125_23510, partial [Chloroflexota bacterium]
MMTTETQPSRRLMLLELAVVLAVALGVTAPFFDLSGFTRLAGGEMEFLTSSAHTAAFGLRAEGRIPWWQPYLGEGRPLLESPFAYVFNPFSAGPVLLLGNGAAGTNLAVVVTAVLAAFGGWFLGYAARLG